MLPTILIIQLASNGDLQAQKLLLSLRKSFPSEKIFAVWILQSVRIGISGPELCRLRAEMGSVCEMICHVLVRYAKKFHGADPHFLLITDLAAGQIRERITW